MNEKILDLKKILAELGINREWAEVRAHVTSDADLMAIYGSALEGLEPDSAEYDDMLIDLIFTNAAEYAVRYPADSGDEENDPTQKQPGTGNGSKPTAVDPQQAAAVNNLLDESMDLSIRNGLSSEIIAVMVQRPYPGDWMPKDGSQAFLKLPVSKDLQHYIDELKGMRKEESVDKLIASSTKFIPTNAQLAELKTKWKTEHPDAKADPVWDNFDNDAAFNAILNVMNNENGMFVPLIPPKDADTGEGAYKLKAWNWQPMGYKVRVPDPNSTTGGTLERIMTKEQLHGYLLTQTDGQIMARESGGLQAMLGSVVDKKEAEKAANAGLNTSEPMKTVLRVKGNRATDKPSHLVIQEQSENKGKLAAKSEMFVYRVAYSKGKFTVSKLRVSLVWDDAPLWITKEEYSSIFSRKNGNDFAKMTDTERKKLQAVRSEYAKRLLADSNAVATYDLGDFSAKVAQRVAEDAATAAKDLG